MTEGTQVPNEPAQRAGGGGQLQEGKPKSNIIYIADISTFQE